MSVFSNCPYRRIQYDLLIHTKRSFLMKYQQVHIRCHNDSLSCVTIFNIITSKIFKIGYPNPHMFDNQRYTNLQNKKSQQYMIVIQLKPKKHDPHLRIPTLNIISSYSKIIQTSHVKLKIVKKIKLLRMSLHMYMSSLLWSTLLKCILTSQLPGIPMLISLLSDISVSIFISISTGFKYFFLL